MMQPSWRSPRVIVSLVTVVSMLLGMVPWTVRPVRAAEVIPARLVDTTNVPGVARDAGASSVRQLTVPSHTVFLPLVVNRYVPPTTTQVDPETGGTVAGGNMTLTFAPGTLTETVTVAYQPLGAPDHLPAETTLIGQPFALTAQTLDGTPVTQFAPEVTMRTVNGMPEYVVTNTVVISVTYTDADVAGLDERALQLYTRAEDENYWHPLLTVVDTAANVARAPLNHFSRFALLGRTAVPSETLVILDPDHGGADPGGTVTTPASYAIEEKTLNLDTALAVKGYLQACGVNVLMTREDDSSLSAAWRAEFINSHAPSGTATIAFNIISHAMSHFMGGPLGIVDLSKTDDVSFTQRLIDEVAAATSLPGYRGVKDARTWGGDGLYLPTHVPTTTYAHLEAAFMDSYYDRDNVIDPKLQTIAGGIYNGIIAHLELTACVPFSGTVVNDVPVTRRTGLGDGVAYTAQGVNPVTGNQFQWFRDLFVPGAGLNVDVVRYYNSLSTEVGLFGKGWSSLYDMRLKVEGDVVLVKYADGRWGKFTSGVGGYEAEPGVFDVLTAEGGGYVLTTPEQIRFEFDGAGVLQAIRNEDGQALTLTYAGGALDAIVDASGRVFDIATNANGLVTNITDPAGRVVTYTYGVMSLERTAYLRQLRGPQAVTAGTDLLAMTNANGGSTNYAYDAAGGYLNRVSDPMGITYLENQYTPDGKVASQKNGNQDESKWDYDLENMKATFTDNEGNKTVYYFDSKYRVIKEEDALGYTVEYEYDDKDNITMRKDKRGNVWRYTYDERGNMLTQSDPLDQWSLYDRDVTTWTYDDKNNPTSMTDALGNTWTYEYNDKGNPTHVVEPNGAETWAEYDSKGQMIRLTDAEGRVTTFAYDDHGNRIETRYQDGGWTKSTYDDAGHELTRTECLNPPACTETRVTTNEYDKNGNVTKTIDPEGAVTRFEYDKNNMLVKKIDRRGGVWTWEYDDELNPTKETNPLGYVTTHTYNKMSKRLSTTDAEGRTTSFVYDKLYRMTQVTDPAGNVYTYDYDPNGNLLTLTDPLGYRTRFVYDAVNRRKFVYDALGGTTEYCYDPLDRIIRAFDPRRAEVQLTYDSVGNQIEVMDPLGNRMTLGYDKVHNVTRQTVGIPSDGVEADGATTTMVYDTRNRVISRTDPLSRTTRTEYDGVGNVVKTTDPMGFASTFVYNKNGWMTTMTDALGGVTRYEYDPEGATTAMVDANGHRTGYAYDLAGQLLTVTDPLNRMTSFVYDKVGNQIKVVNARGWTTNYEYSALNLLVKETDPLGNQTTYDYDALRRMTARTDAEGKTTRYAYNALGWLTSVTDALSQTTRYEYDAVGNRTAIVDANGVRTTFEYNFLDQLKREINPLDKTWEYSYDARGNMIRRVDGKWQATYYEYDKANQLIATVYGQGAGMTAVTFEYDLNGNEIAMHDWNGDWTYTYDALNRRLSATDYRGRTLQWEYDAVGNRTAMIYPNGERVEMTYDAADQLATLTDFAGRAHTWDYDPLGYIQAQVNPNSTRADYVYDAAGRLTNLTNTGAGGAVIAGYTYTLDKVGNRVQTVEQRGPESVTRSYEYDDLYRLTRAQTNTGQDMRYVYDPVGNRLQKVGTPEAAAGKPAIPEDTAYTFNALNAMLTAGPAAFDYDANGNRVRKTEPLTASGYLSAALNLGWEVTGTVTMDYVYDYENRLTQVYETIVYTTSEISGSVVLPASHISPTMEAEYVYDGYGRRVEKHVTTYITATGVLTTPAVFTREYVFDGLDPVAEVEYTGASVTPTVQSAYVYGNGRMVELVRTENVTTTTYWYHYDGLGSVVALTNEAGADVCQWKYDEYGNPLQDCPELNHYTYTGQEYDAETGLTHFFARYYDAETGVWTTQDKYRGNFRYPLTLYRYMYAGNSPINIIDLLGYGWKGFIGGAIGGAIAGCALGALAFGIGCVAGIIPGAIGGALGGHVGEEVGTGDFDAKEDLYEPAKEVVAATVESFVEDPVNFFTGYKDIPENIGKALDPERSASERIMAGGLAAVDIIGDIFLLKGGISILKSGLKRIAAKNVGTQLVKEVAEETGEKIVKEGTEEFVEETGEKIIKEGTEEFVESSSKKLVYSGLEKQTARDALEKLTITTAQKESARRAITKATTSSTVELVLNESGELLVKVSRPGANGFQVFEYTITQGGEKTVIQKAYDASGNLVHFDPK
ncbi:MAG TPA: N-acetylmuramoyl-L-alanine amidase [Anaerolineae bacterium]|nr:N-acetylmuramoyl-L-alanine amidase [Anaerolineae bacterium]